MSTLVTSLELEGGRTVQVRQGDLTAEDAQAIVNAANSRLAHGGGVAGAIVRRGGEAIQQESDAWIAGHGTVPTGEVAVTGGGALPCRHIIHAVGPVWRDGRHEEEALLRHAAWNSLAKAHELGLASLAMPAISSGIFGFPKELCAAILVGTALEFFGKHPGTSLRELRFTNIDRPTVDLFAAELDRRRKA